MFLLHTNHPVTGYKYLAVIFGPPFGPKCVKLRYRRRYNYKSELKLIKKIIKQFNICTMHYFVTKKLINENNKTNQLKSINVQIKWTLIYKLKLNYDNFFKLQIFPSLIKK